MPAGPLHTTPPTCATFARVGRMYPTSVGDVAAGGGSGKRPPAVRRGAKTVRIIHVKRNVWSYRSDLVMTGSDWAASGKPCYTALCSSSRTFCAPPPWASTFTFAHLATPVLRTLILTPATSAMGTSSCVNFSRDDDNPDEAFNWPQQHGEGGALSAPLGVPCPRGDQSTEIKDRPIADHVQARDSSHSELLSQGATSQRRSKIDPLHHALQAARLRQSIDVKLHGYWNAITVPLRPTVQAL
ncbi:hypothetical protein GGX14DRAFT_399482 [Mycena pura]|uniref:Uncharacterized protein n=1 Tax=Mycena pura TaxID=153505 RepID=A0AAD6YCF7_9AGAR|nr:hypothetical protein GGX14DRAFT_399482 [Mycena pura]